MEGSTPVQTHVRISTRELQDKIYKLQPPVAKYKHKALIGEISFQGSVPIPIKFEEDGNKSMDNTEVAFSKTGEFENISLTMRPHCEGLWYWHPHKRSIDLVSQYRYIYLRPLMTTSEPVQEVPEPLWNDENSVKVSVKDLKNKMKAIPKSIRCENTYLKSLQYDSASLPVYCSTTREKFVNAKIATTEYEPMFETTITLTQKGPLVLKGQDGSTISVRPNDFIYLKRTF